jgi:protein-disulfide isomerase
VLNVILGLILIAPNCLSTTEDGVKHNAAIADSTKGSEGITRDQAETIIRELREIRSLLESAKNRAGVPEGRVKLRIPDEAYSLGSKTAQITIVEFSDYQCPFCKRFQDDTFAKLKEHYIDTGKARFVSLDLPLAFHLGALPAAQAARCAGEQRKYWEMRESLIRHSEGLSESAFISYAKGIGLDIDSFRSCIEGIKYKQAIQDDANEAESISVSGTPSFIVAKSSGNNIEGNLIVGAVSYSDFDVAINKLLNSADDPSAITVK